jgi:diadenosine tetraphosphate (Ap4A) HIT family hydrolase
MTDCKICSHPAKNLLEENERAKVLHFHAPQLPGHVIVAAKEHTRFLHDLDPPSVTALCNLLQTSARKIVELLDCDRYYLASIGDRDHHFHFHILPHKEGNPNLGPYVFGPTGWTGNLPSVDNERVKKQLSDNWNP